MAASQEYQLHPRGHNPTRDHREYLNLRDPRDPRENPIATGRRPTSTEYDFILHPELPRPKEQVTTKTTKVPMTPDFFQQYYNDHQELHWTSKFKKPGVIGDLGIILSLTPLSCDLMGWRGAGGDGVASIGAYMFFGGVLLFIAGFLEFVIGNTFGYAVYMSFAAFWFTLAITLQPAYGAYTSYDPTGTPLDGLNSQGFNASFAFFLLFMGLLCVVFLICSLKEDIAHIIVFLSLVIAFGLLTGTHFQGAMGHAATAKGLGIASGVALFVTSMTIWWIFLANMLEALNFPFKIPVGKISGLLSGGPSFQRARVQKEYIYP